MKRALAERVKQDRLGSPVETPSSSGVIPSHEASFTAKSSPSENCSTIAIVSNKDVQMVDPNHRDTPSLSPTVTSHTCPPQSADEAISMPPSSLKKRPRSPPNDTTSGNVASYTEEPAKKRSGKPLKSNDSDSEDESDPTSGSFYLKHQNAALASELYAYRRRIYLLERERGWRRRECGVVGDRIRVLEGVCRGMEEELGLVSA